mmetsp:Transcript_70503/g.103345  ORF Transcript_70503/g.103345 Transcript_70503/m.103345 type:complete len:178 (+) Transcript_70503:35-568(+)
MQPFEAVAPSRQASGRPARAAVLLATMVLAAVALVAMSSSGDRAEPMPAARPVSGLFEEPSISLGIRAHEELADFSQKVPSIAPAARDPTTALPPLTVGTGPMDLATHAQARYNYQMDNTLTWPPHDTDFIPTGSYSAGYKGPYDNDYDWPDDTQVMRNDEWDKSGGVGCGMSGDNC